MRYSTSWIMGALFVLSACGGGGGNSGPNIPPAPPATGTPTAKITDTASPAALAKVGTGGVNALVSSSSVQPDKLPFFINTGSPTSSTVVAPGGISGSTIVACTTRGSINVSYTISNPNGFTTGDNATFGFNNCAFTPDPTVNGTLTMLLARYNSAMDYAITLQTTNFSSTVGGVTDGPYNFIGTIDYQNNIFTYSYNVNGVTVVGQPVVVYTNTDTSISSGTVHVFYDSGWLEATYTNWVINTATGKPVSGSLTLTDANGNTALITTDGSNYYVTITINGAVNSYTVPV